MKRSAVISRCTLYRYELRRVWDSSKPAVLIIGLNPSRADAFEEDNTSRVCINYAKRWGYGSLLLGNLFAYRTPDRSVVRAIADPIGAENDRYLLRLQAEAALVVCAWTDDGAFRNRDQEVLSFLRNPHCIAKLKSGRPGHPLYKRKVLCPIPL